MDTNSLISWVDSHVIDYLAAMNLNYTWSFRSAADFCLGTITQCLSRTVTLLFIGGKM